MTIPTTLTLFAGPTWTTCRCKRRGKSCPRCGGSAAGRGRSGPEGWWGKRKTIGTQKGLAARHLSFCRRSASLFFVFPQKASAFTASLIGAVSKHGGTRKVDSQGEATAPSSPAAPVAPALAPPPAPAAPAPDDGDEDSV
jgi:hypothetical protein